MRSVSSREIITMLKRNGWSQSTVRGSHHQFKHATICRARYDSAPQEGFALANREINT
jgi:hypothetical protein